MASIEDLFENNRRWAKRITESDPHFFAKLSGQQQPEFLWIGCSDSRVPANEIVGLMPGEVFVHRNVANLVVHTDLNCLSVLQYAVEVLAVRHVIVCGHYGCGGVKAAIDGRDHGLIDNWLRHIQEVHRANREAFESLSEDDDASDLLCELNVIAQVGNVCNTTVVRRAWQSGRRLSVHGWIYRVQDGLLRDLEVTASSA